MKSLIVRSYSELIRLNSIEQRYDYLALRGSVGDPTFGSERYLNQRFYRSREWKDIRDYVIVRDDGCDLGVEGFEIHDRILIHHMNPVTIEQITRGDLNILDPEYLIATTHKTHNAIHYGDRSLLSKPHIQRKPGDTKLW